MISYSSIVYQCIWCPRFRTTALKLSIIYHGAHNECMPYIHSTALKPSGNDMHQLIYNNQLTLRFVFMGYVRLSL
jgi:hypothetical protein